MGMQEVVIKAAVMWCLVGSGVGSSGSIALSSLNGANGFKLDGENNGDYSGIPSVQPGISMAMGMPICSLGLWLSGRQ